MAVNWAAIKAVLKEAIQEKAKDTGLAKRLAKINTIGQTASHIYHGVSDAIRGSPNNVNGTQTWNSNDVPETDIDWLGENVKSWGQRWERDDDA